MASMPARARALENFAVAAGTGDAASPRRSGGRARFTTSPVSGLSALTPSTWKQLVEPDPEDDDPARNKSALLARQIPTPRRPNLPHQPGIYQDGVGNQGPEHHRRQFI